MFEYWCLYDLSAALRRNDASSGGANVVVDGRVNGVAEVGLVPCNKPRSLESQRNSVHWVCSSHC